MITVCSIVECTQCSMHKSAQVLIFYILVFYNRYLGIYLGYRYMVFKYLALQLKIIKLSNLNTELNTVLKIY